MNRPTSPRNVPPVAPQAVPAGARLPGRRPGPLAVALQTGIVALLACACAVKAPPRQVWSLTSAGVGAPRSAAGGNVIAVRRFTAAEEIRSTQITWRRSEGREIVRQSDQSWADYPDRLLEEMAIARFSASGRFAGVLTSPPWGHVDGLLACRVVDFSAWDDASGQRARVALRWILTTPAGVVVQQGDDVETVAIASDDAAAAVAAFEAAASAIVGRLVESTATSLANRPAAVK